MFIAALFSVLFIDLLQHNSINSRKLLRERRKILLQRKKLLLRIAELLKLSPLVSNFLKLLFDKLRLAALPGIAQVYQHLSDELENLKRAQVKSAVPLDEDTQKRLGQALEELTKSKVVMEFEEDPAIIGGVIARVGDLVLDGTVRSQLYSLRESLIKGEVL